MPYGFQPDRVHMCLRLCPLPGSSDMVAASVDSYRDVLLGRAKRAVEDDERRSRSVPFSNPEETEPTNMMIVLVGR